MPSELLQSLTAKLRKEGSISFEVKVIPKSKNNEIIGWLGDKILKIKIAATPEKGKANKALIKFLSKALEVPQQKTEIISGETSPHKIVKISL